MTTAHAARRPGEPVEGDAGDVGGVGADGDAVRSE